MENAEWYVNWFNSPYYHLLYNNRNDKEANFFIDNLCNTLSLKQEAKIWDLACGKGRHAIALSKKKYHVTGTDLATNSIAEASKHANEWLHFEVHDMLVPFKTNHFDAVFNLFTSIGYFKNYDDNFRVFKNVAESLVPGGQFVVDFFNSKKVISSFKSEYVEERGTVRFEIKKTIQNKAIIKHIEFNAGDKNYYFEESVSLFQKQDFVDFATKAGLTLQACYGNHHLDPFCDDDSERLILIFKK